MTALHIAISNKDHDILNLLLQSDYVLNEPDEVISYNFCLIMILSRMVCLLCILVHYMVFYLMNFLSTKILKIV